jgi:hypothetical protein
MSGSITNETVGNFDKGASYGCLRCQQPLPSHEHQDAHNASKHSQPQGGGTAYRAVDKTKV